MVGPVYEVETTGRPHRNLIPGVTNTVAASILLDGPVPAGVPPVDSCSTDPSHPAPGAGPDLLTKNQPPGTIVSVPR